MSAAARFAPMPIDPAKLAPPGVRTLAPYIPGKPLEELEREYGISDSIKLASNENPLGPGRGRSTRSRRRRGRSGSIRTAAVSS